MSLLHARELLGELVRCPECVAVEGFGVLCAEHSLIARLFGEEWMVESRDVINGRKYQDCKGAGE